MLNLPVLRLRRMTYLGECTSSNGSEHYLYTVRIGLAMWPFSSPIRGKLDGHGVSRHLSSLVSKPGMHDSIVFRMWAEMIGFRCVPYILSLRPLSYLTRGDLVLKEPRPLNLI